jgi:hypothetical protein
MRSIPPTLLLLASLSHPLSACTCAITPACIKVTHATVIFVAKVLKTGKEINSYSVEEAIRGVAPDLITIDIADDPVCGGGIATGATYLLFASPSNGTLTTVGNCGWTVPIESAGDILEFLRSQKRGQHLTMLYGAVGDEPDLDWPAFAWEPEHPLAGVEILATVGEDKYQAVSDELGHFRIVVSKPGDYKATARLAGHISVRDQKGSLKADACADLPFQMRKGPRVTP